MKIVQYKILPNAEIVSITNSFYQILNPRVVDDDIYIWCEILTNENAKPLTLNFITIGTDWDIPDEFLIYWKFAGSVEKDGKIWHVYYSQSKEETCGPAELKEEDCDNDEYKSTEET